MSKKFITGEKLNELFVEVANFVCKKDVSNFHVFTFKRFSARELNPRFCVMIIYQLKKGGI